MKSFASDTPGCIIKSAFKDSSSAFSRIHPGAIKAYLQIQTNLIAGVKFCHHGFALSVLSKS